MKLFQTGAIVLCTSVLSLTAAAQKLKLIEGDLSVLKSETCNQHMYLLTKI